MAMDNELSTKTKEELIKLLKNNIKTFNIYREQTNYEPLDLSDGRFQGTTLTGAKLQNIDFSGADFEYANLVSADLTNCKLQNTLMIYTNLTSANLSNAVLEGADFTGAQLENAKLDGANLTMALFSKANFTNVSLNQTNLDSANFCSANLCDTNFKNALNIKHCIFDKFTRWPSEAYLPKDFNPDRGMYGSEDDFSIRLNADSDSQSGPLSPDDLKSKLMQEVHITGKGLPEIEKQQILLDRKLDYLIATMKVLTEKVSTAPQTGMQGYTDDSYGSFSGLDSGGGAGVNNKLQELDDKIENIASFLTRFPVKSLEETYKLTDVITKIETTQNDICAKLNESVSAITRANDEIQSILSGKLRASYISGLDKMFNDTIETIKKTIHDTESSIIRESTKFDFNLDESFIAKELETQFAKTTGSLREEMERKLGTHGLFLKQIDEKLEKVQEKADVHSIFNQLRDDFDTKFAELTNLNDRISEKHDQQLNQIFAKTKLLDQKIDIMSETATLNTISNLIAEFGAGFSSELQMVKDAAIAIENRLKGLTGEVDLSTDFAIEAIAKSVNKQLMETISGAIENAQISKQNLQELNDNINKKLELLGKIFDAKTNYLEGKVHDAVIEASATADSGIVQDINELKSVAESINKQLEELENFKPEEAYVNSIKDALASRMQDLIAQAKSIPSEFADSHEIQDKAEILQQMNKKIAEKLDHFYDNFEQRSDVLEEKVDEIAQSELEELMNEFSQELEDLRDSVGRMDLNTKETIKIQGISSQEIINNLREDLSASVEEVIKSLKNMQEEGVMPREGSKLFEIKEDLTEKAENLKHIGDRISEKMEHLFENINKKTSLLEQKVDILAQAETDTPDVISDLLAEFEEDVNSELQNLKEMLSLIENRLSDPTFNGMSTEVITKNLIDKLQTKVESAVDKTNEALIKRITGVLEEDREFKESKLPTDIEDIDYDKSIVGDIAYIKDVVSDIQNKLPDLDKDTIKKLEEISNSIKAKFDELQINLTSRTGSIEEVMNEIVKEASLIPAASKTFGIDEDLQQLKMLAQNIDGQLKEVKELTPVEQPTALDNLQSDVGNIIENARVLAEQAGNTEIAAKITDFETLTTKMTEKMKEVAGQIADNIDIEEQLSSATEGETIELLEEFTSELEDLKEFIHSSSSATKESLKEQAIVNEESINKLREDVTSSIDRMVQNLSGVDKGSFVFEPTIEKIKIDEDITEKQKMMKEVSEKITTKIDSFLDLVQKKTKVLEQKMDILAQTETDSTDVFSELLVGFKDELLTELAAKQTPTEGETPIETPDAIFSGLLTGFKDELLIELAAKLVPAPTEGEKPGETPETELVSDKVNTIAQEITQISETLLAIQDSVEELQDQQVISMAREVSEINEKLTSIEDIIQGTSVQEITDIVVNLENTLAEKIANIKETIEGINNNLIKLDESSTESIVKKIDNLTENGIKIDSDILIDNIKDELEEKIADLNFEEVISASVGDLSHKIEKLYEDVMDLTIALETKIDELSEKDPTEELDSITESLNNLKDTNIELSSKISQLTKDVSAETVTDMITDVETSVAKEVEFLRNIGESISQRFNEFESVIDTSKLENNLKELAQFNEEVATKLDKVLDATGNIDSEALLTSIKEHLEERLTEILDQDVGLEQILENLGSDISEKLTAVLDHNHEIDTKLDKVIEKDTDEQLDNILGDLHALKTTILTMNEKVDMLHDETKKIDLEELIHEFQKDVEAKIELIAEMANTDNILTPLNDTLEEFYSGIMEKTSLLQEKVEAISPDDIAEGIDNLTTDISLLKSLTEDITEKIEKVLATTEDLQTQEGMEHFRESLENKLNALIESEESINIENLLANINTSLGSKIDSYYSGTRNYISDLLETLEENVISATTETQSVAVSEFVDSAEEKVNALYEVIKEVTANVELVQDLSKNTLLTKNDIKDLYANIDDITLSLNEKTDALLNKLEQQLDDSDLSGSLKVFRRELEKRIDTLTNFTDTIKEKLESDLDTSVSSIGHTILGRIESLYSQLVAETGKLENKVDTLAGIDVVSQIDGLVSDVLVELDQEVNRIGKITANVDRNIMALDKNIKVIDMTTHSIDNKIDHIEEGIKQLPDTITNDIAKKEPASQKDNAIEALVGFMQKDADQKLLLMKEIIHSSANRGGYPDQLETRLKNLENHLASESKKHEEKIQTVLTSVKALLGDIENLKDFNPMPTNL